MEIVAHDQVENHCSMLQESRAMMLTAKEVCIGLPPKVGGRKDSKL